MGGGAMRKVSPWLASCLLLLLVAVAAAANKSPTSSAPQTSSAQALMAMPPDELVRRVVQNELNAREVGHFLYRDVRPTPDGSKTKEMIETRDGVVARLIAINGKPLTPDERANENARLQNLLQHPELQQRKQREQQQDEERVKRMFRELPKAFIYVYDGIEPGNWGELIRLKFHPNPNYDAPSRETSVFKAMNGTLWVNAT
jgi:hypothetical protein